MAFKPITFRPLKDFMYYHYYTTYKNIDKSVKIKIKIRACRVTITVLLVHEIIKVE